MYQELKEKLQAEADPELASNDLMDKGRAELALELLKWLEKKAEPEIKSKEPLDHWSKLQLLNQKIDFWMDKEEEAKSNLLKAMSEKDYISNTHLRY